MQEKLNVDDLVLTVTQRKLDPLCTEDDMEKNKNKNKTKQNTKQQLQSQGRMTSGSQRNQDARFVPVVWASRGGQNIQTF